MTFIVLEGGPGTVIVNTEAIIRIEPSRPGDGCTLFLVDGTSYRITEDAETARLAITLSSPSEPRSLTRN